MIVVMKLRKDLSQIIKMMTEVGDVTNMTVEEVAMIPVKGMMAEVEEMTTMILEEVVIILVEVNGKKGIVVSSLAFSKSEDHKNAQCFYIDSCLHV